MPATRVGICASDFRRQTLDVAIELLTRWSFVKLALGALLMRSSAILVGELNGGILERLSDRQRHLAGCIFGLFDNGGSLVACFEVQAPISNPP